MVLIHTHVCGGGGSRGKEGRGELAGSADLYGADLAGVLLALSLPGAAPLLSQSTFFLSSPLIRNLSLGPTAQPGSPPGLNSCSLFTGIVAAGCFPWGKQPDGL